MLYATALEIDHHEAREIAGLRVGPRPFSANPRARLVVLAGVAAAAVALTAAFVIPGHAEQRAREAQASRLAAEAALPKPWQIDVDVLNGNGDIVFTRQIASRVGALGYHIARVRRANRFDYPETAVYYERGGYDVAARLARQLGVGTRPLPGGHNPQRLVVIVGPHRGPALTTAGRPECRELFFEARRHVLGARDAHVAAELLLEAEAVAPRASLEVRLDRDLLLERERPVEERLHDLFAVIAGIHHVASTARSASSCFSTRRARCKRDITVPIGMSRICAASW